ncbi:hypothetical protein [Sphingobium sp. B2]|uniref:hypothetical protein n=1 Tax=Sphingobium sp. B2 TaxID=2583228 RepID=UPI00119F9A64|nr:hypothetical protein [Sphingobium sp. B2]
MIGLSLSLSLGSQRGQSAPANPLCNAINAKVLVAAKDGDTVLKLAPHIVYKWTKKETPVLDAVLLERDGKSVNKTSLRRYPVEALSEITILDEGFTVDPDFDANDPAYSRGAFCVVESV